MYSSASFGLAMFTLIRPTQPRPIIEFKRYKPRPDQGYDPRRRPRRAPTTPRPASRRGVVPIRAGSSVPSPLFPFPRTERGVCVGGGAPSNDVSEDANQSSFPSTGEKGQGRRKLLTHTNNTRRNDRALLFFSSTGLVMSQRPGISIRAAGEERTAGRELGRR